MYMVTVLNEAGQAWLTGRRTKVRVAPVTWTLVARHSLLNRPRPPTPSAFGSPVPPASLSGVTDQPAPAGPSPCAPTRPKEDRATWTLTNGSLGLRRLPRVKRRTGPGSRGSRAGKGRAPA